MSEEQIQPPLIPQEQPILPSSLFEELSKILSDKIEPATKLSWIRLVVWELTLPTERDADEADITLFRKKYNLTTDTIYRIRHNKDYNKFFSRVLDFFITPERLAKVRNQLYEDALTKGDSAAKKLYLQYEHGFTPTEKSTVEFADADAIARVVVSTMKKKAKKDKKDK